MFCQISRFGYSGETVTCQFPVPVDISDFWSSFLLGRFAHFLGLYTVKLRLWVATSGGLGYGLSSGTAVMSKQRNRRLYLGNDDISNVSLSRWQKRNFKI